MIEHLNDGDTVQVYLSTPNGHVSSLVVGTVSKVMPDCFRFEGEPTPDGMRVVFDWLVEKA